MALAGLVMAQACLPRHPSSIDDKGYETWIVAFRAEKVSRAKMNVGDVSLAGSPIVWGLRSSALCPGRRDVSLWASQSIEALNGGAWSESVIVIACDHLIGLDVTEKQWICVAGDCVSANGSSISTKSNQSLSVKRPIVTSFEVNLHRRSFHFARALLRLT